MCRLVAVAVLSPILIASIVAQAAGPDAGHIAFHSGVDIWLVSPDGTSAPANLTQSVTYNAMPSWSPEGDQIAFYSNREQNSEIYVMRADGSLPTRLTRNPGAINANPDWSPGSDLIVFHSTRDGNSEIYVEPADGSLQTNLTSNAADDRSPLWSPDGRRIAFLSDRLQTDGHQQLYVMDADGGRLRQITTDRANLDWAEADILFDWSPDGRFILFTAGDRDRPNDADLYELMVVPSDGSEIPHALTANSVMETDGVYSPDGSKIAYKTNCDGNDEVYVANADGSDAFNVTHDPGSDSYPAWSPDGTRIAFQSDRSGRSEIYVTDLDGSPATRLTRTEQGAYAPVWVRW